MNFKNQIYTPGDNDIGGEGYDLVTKKKLERYNEAFGSDELVHTVCPWLGRRVFRIEAISFDSFVCAGVGGGSFSVYPLTLQTQNIPIFWPLEGWEDVCRMLDVELDEWFEY